LVSNLLHTARLLAFDLSSVFFPIPNVHPHTLSLADHDLSLTYPQPNTLLGLSITMETLETPYQKYMVTSNLKA
jgi:hypothetical protein